MRLETLITRARSTLGSQLKAIRKILPGSATRTPDDATEPDAGADGEGIPDRAEDASPATPETTPGPRRRERSPRPHVGISRVLTVSPRPVPADPVPAGDGAKSPFRTPLPAAEADSPPAGAAPGTTAPPTGYTPAGGFVSISSSCRPSPRAVAPVAVRNMHRLAENHPSRRPASFDVDRNPGPEFDESVEISDDFFGHAARVINLKLRRSRAAEVG